MTRPQAPERLLLLAAVSAADIRAGQTAALIPGAELVVIDVGLVIHVGAPQESLAVVERFLDSA
jgi:hypothetical protein